jgi:hypothetical protein
MAVGRGWRRRGEMIVKGRRMFGNGRLLTL